MNSYGTLKEDKSVNQEKDEREVSKYEDVIKEIGYGRFFFVHLFVCGFAVMADALEILSLSVVLLTATCDLQLTSRIKGWIDASVFIGMMLGSYVWGSLADISGRRFITISSLTVNWSAAFASSFVNGYPEFLVLRLISGIGIGGSVPVIFAYFIEFQHKSSRGKMVCLLTLLWMSGNAVEAGLAWLVIPTNIGIETSLITYKGWRFFIALCAIPSFLASISFFFMPESPKYLLQKGQEEEAIKVMNKISNKELHIKKLVFENEETDELLKDNTVKDNKSCNFMKSILLQSWMLFQKPNLSLTLAALGVFSVFSFGYYGLFMWFPELFKRFENSGSSPCDFIQFKNTTQYVVNEDSIDTCKGPSDEVYFQSFVTMFTSMFGPIVPTLLVDKTGRRPMMFCTLFLCAVSLFFFYLVKTKTEILILSSLFAFLATAAWAVIDVAALEIFPTNLRSTAFGLLAASIRVSSILANVLFGIFIEEHCSLLIILPAALILLSSLFSCFLPDRTDKEIS